MVTTIQCHICGNPLVCDIPDDVQGLPRDTVLNLAKITVHNACADAADYQRRRLNEATRTAKCLQSWEMLAPLLYHSSEAWMANEAASKTINRARINDVLNWEWGAKGLVMFGAKSGTGKTLAAYLLLKLEMLKGRAACAITHVEFARKAISLNRTDGKTAERWIRLLATCDILLVDDLGQSAFKRADGEARLAEELLFDVIDGRIGKQLPTLMTSNDNTHELKRKLSAGRGEPLLRRMREFFTPINFDQ